jgi:uncharacterized membrane protein
MRDPSDPPPTTAPTDLATPRPPGGSWPQRFARWLLGAALVLAGLSHLTVGREEFLTQVPPWLPLEGDLVVVASGIVEIALGLALLVLGRWSVPVGWLVALFFLAIFPGNIAQFTEGRDGFGLTTDVARGIRLLLQPLLVAWALWSTGAWAAYRSWRSSRRHDRSGTMRA